MGLPFLTVLAPSKRFYAGQAALTPRHCWTGLARSHCKSTAGCRGRRIVIVGDTAFAAIDISSVRSETTMSASSPDCASDANLYALRTPQTTGPRTTSGQGQALAHTDASATRCRHKLAAPQRVNLWYGRTNRVVEIATGARSCLQLPVLVCPPVPIRWLLVRDPLGELPPQAFLCTDLDAAPIDILQWFVLALAVGGYLSGSSCPSRRGNAASVVRSGDHAHHPGANLACSRWILRSGRMTSQPKHRWFPRPLLGILNNTAPLSSDAIAAVRRQIWHHQVSFMSRCHRDSIKIPRQLWDRAPQTLSPMPRDSIKSSLEIVAILQLAIPRIVAPAADDSVQGDDDTLRAGSGHDHLGRQGV